jgi:hypothetical protein
MMNGTIRCDAEASDAAPYASKLGDRNVAKPDSFRVEDAIVRR